MIKQERGLENSEEKSPESLMPGSTYTGGQLSAHVDTHSDLPEPA